jgi:NAD(P)H dehydrogenase (quinone)
MYTVPAKTNIQAKNFISAIEKGDWKSLKGEDEDEEPHRLHPQLSTEELASPGITNQLRLVFEAKRQESLTSPPAAGVKSPTSAGVRLSRDRFTGFESQPDETKVLQPVVNGTSDEAAVRSASVVIEKDVGGTEVSVTVTKEVVTDRNDGRDLKGKDTDDVNKTVAASVTLSTEGAAITNERKDNEKVTQALEETSTSFLSETDVKTASVTIETTSANPHPTAEVVEEKLVEKVTEKVVEKVVEEKASDARVQATQPEQVNVVVEKVVEAGPGDVRVQATQQAVVSAVVGPQRNVLVVKAVKTETPLDAALRELTLRRLTDAGHDVTASDAYELERSLSPLQDFDEERKRLQRADLVIFQLRTLLNNCPAALMAWFENVLAQNDGQQIDKVTLKGKRCIILATSDVEPAADDDQNNLKSFLLPIQTGIFRVVGIDVLPAVVLFGAKQNLDDAARKLLLDQWENRLVKIWDEIKH